MKLVAIKTSFRPRSNSSILLAAAAEGARSAGATVEVVDLTGRTIGPCRACDACARTGKCIFTDDDLVPLLEDIWEAGRVLVATPVHFMSVPAQLKLLVDRTQCLYNRKYVLRERLEGKELSRRRGGVIAVCGSRHEEGFEALDLTMRYFFDSLQIELAERLYVARVDSPGEIERHPERIAQARELGERLGRP